MLGRAICVAMVGLLFGCNGPAQRAKRCQEAVELADYLLREEAKKLDEEEDFTTPAEQRSVADGYLKDADAKCVAAQSPNSKEQLARLTPQRATTEASIKAAEDRRKKDPNIAKRGPMPKNSGWDGSIPQVERWVKERLKDPDSYKHSDTSIPVAEGPFWRVETSYRAKNSFGALILETHTLWLQQLQVVKSR